MQQHGSRRMNLIPPTIVLLLFYLVNKALFKVVAKLPQKKSPRFFPTSANFGLSISSLSNQKGQPITE
jgi:hypothetical protein